MNGGVAAGIIWPGASMMTVNLDLPSDLAARIRERAAEQGVDARELMVRVLGESREFRPDPPDPPAAVLPSREAELLRKLDLGFSADTWARYRQLVARRRAEALTTDEHAELLDLTARLEAANVRRLEVVAELANLRGRGLEETMQEVGVGPVGGPYDD